MLRQDSRNWGLQRVYEECPWFLCDCGPVMEVTEVVFGFGREMIEEYLGTRPSATDKGVK
jgi:hypothetical protein